MAAKACRVITMLPSTPQVEAVYLDTSSGILAGLKRLKRNIPPLSAQAAQDSPHSDTTAHTLLIDQTTLDPTAARRIASTIQQETQGRALMLDAPVSGG
jgi:3-hydroxyisobutyrate dehydrogenase